jgi:glycine/D-amino acid oxidase-like deaminating enzyme
MSSLHHMQDETVRTRSADVYDAAVVGGGLVGSAIAFGLRDALEHVAVLDEDDRAYRASRGNAGLVWVQGKGLGMAPYVNWTVRSAQLWPRFAARLLDCTGIDVCLEQKGGLHPAFSDAEFEARRSEMERLASQPGVARYDWSMLDRRQVEELVPGIGPELRGASWTALDGTVNPLKLLRSLHVAFARRGVDYLPHHRVMAISENRGVFQLSTQGPIIRARKIVLASGLGNVELGRQVGLNLPVRPQRGQVIVLERTRRILQTPFTTLRQMDEGSWIIGDSHEEAGYDDSMTNLPVLATLADRAVKLLPALTDVRVVRTWAALRVMSQDGFPVYEQSRSHPGAFVATCHSGVTLAAAHALLLSAMIVQGQIAPEMQPFSTSRFDVHKAA